MHRYSLASSLSDLALLGLTMTSKTENVKRGKPNGVGGPLGTTSFPGSFVFPQEGVVDHSLLWKDERPWERGCSREDSDLSLFKSKRNRMLVLINNARQEYYSNLVAENCHDQAKLLKVSKTLLNLQADNMLALHDNASSLAHEMGEYFVRKISTTRSKLDSHCPSSFKSSPMPTQCHNGNGLSQFYCLSDDYVK